jgi:CubicO group peptidase (beta-lactamase class C family)
MLTTAVLLSATVFLHADDLVLSRFGDYLDSLRAQAGIPGLAAAIVSTTDVTWERAFGQQDVERNVGTRTDTPFQLDAVTQLLVAARTLRCVEDGRLSLDDPASQFDPGSTDGATLRQLLTHTTSGADGLRFAYRPDRLAPLAAAVAACTGDTFSGAMISLLERFSMVDSVPGSDGASWLPAASDPGGTVSQRYTRVLGRLATPYTVDSKGKPSASRYSSTSFTPASGLISTVRDLARFDLALRKDGVLLQTQTLALAWTPPVDRIGRRLPHGLGWFLQSYNGEPIVWQFGASDNGSSSIILTAPTRGLTLILLANSSGLARPFSLEAGDVTVSPFARLFLEIFVR